MTWNLCSRTLRALLLPATFLLPFANTAHAQVFDPTTFELDNGMQVVVIEGRWIEDLRMRYICKRQQEGRRQQQGTKGSRTQVLRHQFRPHW